MTKVKVINCHLCGFCSRWRLLCSALCTNFIPMVTISHIIYLMAPLVVLSWFTTTLPTVLCPCFWRLVSWSRLFGSNICDSFRFWRNSPHFSSLSSQNLENVFFSSISVCALPDTKINQMFIYLWDHQEVGGESMPSFSYLNINW